MSGPKCFNPLGVVLDARTLDDRFPGIGRYTFHLALTLAGRPDVSLTLVVNPRAQNTRFPLEALAEVPKLFLPFPPLSVGAQLAALPLAVALRRTGAVLYHSPYYVMPYALPCTVVVTAHDTIPDRFPHLFPQTRYWVIRTLKRLALRRARHIVADSYATAADLTRYYGVDPARITVAPLAPGPQFQPQDPDAQSAIRERHGLPPRFAVYVGSTKPHKNIPFLLRVWEKVRHRNLFPEPWLVLAGPGTDRVRRDGVIGLGPIPEEELPALYASAWVCLFPSLWEGFGLPPVEAMACGTPVVCSAVAPLQETVGEGGLLLPLEESVWVEAIVRLWHDESLREEWAQRALAQARQFSWEKTAAQTVEAYRQALA